MIAAMIACKQISQGINPPWDGLEKEVELQGRFSVMIQALMIHGQASERT